jgi:hypothetical protein
MPIVLNKNGLQSKRVEDINNKDVILTYSSPTKPYGSKGGGGGVPIEGIPGLPTAQQIRNTLVVSAVEQPKNKLDKVSSQLRDRIMLLRTANLRSGGTFNLNREKNLALYTFSKTIVDEARGIKSAPSTIKAIYQNPHVIKEIPKIIREEGANFGTLIKESPTEATVQIGTQVLILKGTSKAIKLVSRAGNNLARLSPKFKGVLRKGGKITLNIDGEVTKLRIVRKIPTSKIRKQVLQAGKTVRPVSTQANRLVNLIRRSRAIRKPLGELKLSKYSKNLLRKLDKGQSLTRKEIIKLNKSLRKAGSKGLLERSFFADPTGKIRPSRLGLQEKEAGFMDYLSGDITFKKTKPQILVFKEQKLSKFPKSLRKITAKLKKGKALNQEETAKLLKFQLKKTGKFKPLGHVTRESEITLAPGEIIKREKKIGVTLYKGRRIPIVQARVIKPSKKLGKLISKGKAGTLARKELKSLKRLMKKETGFKLRSSSYSKSKKYFSLKRNLFSPAISGLSSLRRSKVKYSSNSRKSKYSKTSKVSPISKYRGGPGTPYKSGSPEYIPKPKYSSKTYKKSYGSSGKTARIPPKTVRLGTLPYKQKGKYKIYKVKLPVYNVYGKSGKKFIKINTAPLIRKDALSRGTYAVDHSTSKTFKIIPIGKHKRVGSIQVKERNYFNKKNYKLRSVRIRKGQKFKLRDKFIEKRRFGIDTQGEKRGLSLARLKKSKKW